MAFFHAQAPIIQPIQSHHDHSYPASGSTINDELDVETAALIANLALDDFANDMSSIISNDEIAYLLQFGQLDESLSTVADAKDAKSIDSSLVADSDPAHMNPFFTAEEEAVEDRIAAERLSHGEELPAPKSCQTRLEDPNFLDPELITVYVWMIFFRQFVILIDCQFLSGQKWTLRTQIRQGQMRQIASS